MGSLVRVTDEVDAYRAEPQGSKVQGALVLIHEIWGLVPHIEDVAERLAAAGYLTLAPDLLSRVGMDAALGQELFTAFSSSDEEVRSAAQPRMREVTAPARAPEFARWAVEQLRACVDLLAADPRVAGRIGAVGFCFGGTYAFAVAAADDRVRAAVPFYGVAPDDVRTIAGSVLALYGETDERVTSTAEETRQRLTESGVDAAAYIYPGVGHAFFNDGNPHTYDAAAAQDAWERMLAFLEARLDAPAHR